MAALPVLLLCWAATAATASQGDTHGVNGVDSLFPVLVPWAGMYARGNVSSQDEQCARDSKLMKKSFDDRILWAARMVDASARGVSGALWSSRFQLGSFDSCVSVVSPVGAQYCLVGVSVRPARPPASTAPPPPPWTHVQELGPHQDAAAVINGEGLLPGFRVPGDALVAQCVPASCRPAALQLAMQAMQAVQALPAAVEVRPSLCTQQRPAPRTHPTTSKLFWGVLAALGVATLVAPLADLAGWRCLSWLDWRRHVSALARPDAALEGLDLSALSGIRCLTTIIITAAHGAALTMSGATSNLAVHKEAYSSPILAPAFHGQILNATYLFLSGVLTVVCKSKHGLLRSLVIRFLRLAPLYLLTIVFTIAVLPAIGSGPLWQSLINTESNACSNLWWANLLFINNHTPFSAKSPGCLFHTWFLAVEMQLFVACLLLRPRERSWRALLAALVLSLLPPLLGTLRFHWPAIAPNRPLHLELVQDSHWFRHGYVPAYMRATAFIVGLITGKLLLQLKKRPAGFAVRAPATWLLTAGSVAALQLLLSSCAWMLDTSRPYSPLETALFASLSPALWAAALGALLVAIVFGEHTWVRGLLCWQPLVTLSRLTYGVYITSFILQTAKAGGQRDTKTLGAFSLVYEGAADVTLFFLLSFVLHILVEAPVRLATRALLERPKEKTVMNGFGHSAAVKKEE